MHHTITTYGGGELFFLIFNGIAALFKEDGTGLVIPMMRIGLMVGSVYIVILMLFKNSLLEGIRWLLWVMVATNLLFLPKTTIHIRDPLNNYRRDVANVPFTLGLVASLTSQIGKEITEKMESVFSLPDYMPYHQTGTVFASSLMGQLGKFRITDPTFKGNMDRFVNQCVVYDAMIGQKYTLTDLQNTPDIWNLVTTNASPVLGFLYKGNAGAPAAAAGGAGMRPAPPPRAPTTGEIVTCRDGARRLNALWNQEIQKVTSVYGSRVHNQNLTEAVFNRHLLGSARLLSNAALWATSAQDILKQELMINAVEDGTNNKLSELGSAGNYAATKALLQQRSAYAAAGEIAARTLPLFKNVIEALSYALFIFIVALAMLPNGHKVLLTYTGILVWTQLWAPLYAVLNLIMTLYGKAETLGAGANTGLTLLNSSAIINANADTATLAAWLSVSIPFISYGILKQGAAAFVGLAHHLGSAMQSAASSTAAETVSGNISMGNITMGTQAYQNTSAFQNHTSPSYNTSQFKSLSGSGVEQSTFADGTQSVHDQGLSNTSVTLMASVNTAMEQQQRLHEAQSVANSKSLSAGKSLESAAQQTANVLERVGSDSFASESMSQNLTSTESKALQDHHNFVKDISENLNLSKTAANDLAVHIKAGTPELAIKEWKMAPVGADIAGGASNSISHQDMIQKAQSISEQRNHTYSLDSALSAAKNLMEGQNDTKGAELAQSASANLSEAQHLREEASLAQTNVKELSSSLSSSQRNDFQENRNVTQDFLEFVASQPINQGPDGFGLGNENQPKIGMEGALSIVDSGGADYRTYLNRFQEENPQYRIQGIDTQREGQKMGHVYKAQAHGLKQESDLHSHHQKEVSHVEQRGKELDLDQSARPTISPQEAADLRKMGGFSEEAKAPYPDFKTQSEQQFSKADGQIAERRQENIGHEAQSEDKAKDALYRRFVGISGPATTIFSWAKEAVTGVSQDPPPFFTSSEATSQAHADRTPTQTVNPQKSSTHAESRTDQPASENLRDQKENPDANPTHLKEGS